MPFMECGGFRMHYEVQNILPHDTLFIHGNLASNAWWMPAADIWRTRRQETGRAIFAEWRGCGKSSGPELDGELTMETLAGDYIHLLDQLGCKKVNIIGHSTGGMIALHAMRDRPDLFRKAILLDSVSASGVQFSADKYDVFTAMSQKKEICTSVLLSTMHKSLKDTLQHQIMDEAFNVHPLIWHGVPQMLGRINFQSSLPSIPHPTLVLHGEYDTLLPIAGSEKLAQGLPEGHFQQIADCGHCPNVEDPELFTSLVDSFFWFQKETECAPFPR